MAIALVSIAGTAICMHWDFFENQYEDMVFAANRSAALAYQYGEKHLNGETKGQYDIRRAQYFFQIALRLDPKMPLVRHELARVMFLRGDFLMAYSYISGEIGLSDEPASISSYYVRGLIEGFMEKYEDAERDYALYLHSEPTDWAAANDLAWILLRSGKYDLALNVTTQELEIWPNNPWLLNNQAIAFYELGRFEEAKVSAVKAAAMVQELSLEDWAHAYPGNDPTIAREGLDNFRDSVRANIRNIENALSA